VSEEATISCFVFVLTDKDLKISKIVSQIKRKKNERIIKEDRKTFPRLPFPGERNTSSLVVTASSSYDLKIIISNMTKLMVN
jgi:hypothetical protein